MFDDFNNSQTGSSSIFSSSIKNETENDNIGFLKTLGNIVSATPEALVSTGVEAISQLAEGVHLVEDNDAFSKSILGGVDKVFNSDVSGFRERHEKAVEAVGGIVGAFAPGALAVKVVRSKALYKGLTTVLPKPMRGFAKGLTSTGRSNSDLAQSFVLRSSLTDDVAKGAKSVEQLSPFALKRTKQAFLKRSISDVMVESFAAEGAIAAVLHKNEFMYPSDLTMGEHLANSALAGGVIGGLAAAGAKYTFNSRLTSMLGKIKRETGGVDVSGLTQNPQTAMIALSLISDRMNFLKDGIKNTEDSGQVAVMNAEIAGLHEQLSEGIQLLGQYTKDGSFQAPFKPGKDEIASLVRAVEASPDIFHDAVSIEKFGPAYHTKIDERIDFLRKEMASPLRTPKELGKLKKQLAHAVNKSVVVIEPSGERSLLDHRIPRFQDGDRKINRVRGKNESTLESPDETFGVSFGDNGAKFWVEGKKNRKAPMSNVTGKKSFDLNAKQHWSNLNVHQKTAVWDAAQHHGESAVERELIRLPKDAHFTQIDEALNSGIDIEVDGLTKTKAELAMHSLDLKYRAYARGKENYLTLNLPNPEQSPVNILTLFETLNVASPKGRFSDLYKDMDGVKQALSELSGVPAKDIADKKLVGSMLNINRVGKPAIIIHESSDPLQSKITKNALFERAATEKIKKEKILAGSGIVGQITRSLQKMKSATVFGTEQITGLLGGTINVKSLMGETLQTGFRYRQMPGHEEFFAAGAVSKKAVEKAVADLITRSKSFSLDPIAAKQGNQFVPASEGVESLSNKQIMERLLSKGHEGDFLNFMHFRHALSKGWDIDVGSFKDFVPREAVQIPLINSKANRLKWAKENDGQPMPEGALLPGSETLRPFAFDVARVVDSLSQKLRAEVNTVNKANGQQLIKKKNFHFPATELKGKNRVILLNAAGETIGQTVGQSPKEALSAAQRVVAKAKEDGAFISFVTEDSVEVFKKAKDDYLFSTEQFSVNNTKGKAKGTITSPEVAISHTDFKAMFESLTRGFNQLQPKVHEAYFSDQLKFLRLQKTASGKVDEDDVFDVMSRLISQREQGRPNSKIRKAFDMVETSYDHVLKQVYEGRVAAAQAAPEVRFGKHRRKYERAKNQGFMPYNNFTDFMQNTTDVPLPGYMLKHSALLNNVVAATGLRILGTGAAVVNVLSVIPAIPSVLNALRRSSGETTELWRSRTNAWNSPVSDIPNFSATKAMVAGMHYGYNTKRGREIVKKASVQGFLDAPVAEQIATNELVGESFVRNLALQGVNAASKLVDTTERWAKTQVFMSAAHIGETLLKITDDDALIAFATKQANNGIADFSHANKPDMFTGAVGMPFGLFTTYMWNLFHRIYGNVERRQSKALAAQMFTQFGLFGADSLPGAEQLIGAMTSNMSESHTLQDRLTEAFGADTSDIMMNGTLAHSTGISFAPRAGIGAPFQGSLSIESFPIVRLGQRIAGGLAKTVDEVRATGKLSAGQIAETLATTNLNRGLSDIIQISQGRSIDNNGNLVENEGLGWTKPNSVETYSRILGFKPLYADETRQENWRNRQTDFHRLAAKTRMGRMLQGHARRGTLTNEHVEQALQGYMDAGGDGKNFRAYLKRQIVKGTQTKRSLDIAKALKRSHDDGRLGRLLYLDEQTIDF